MKAFIGFLLSIHLSRCREFSTFYKGQCSNCLIHGYGYCYNDRRNTENCYPLTIRGGIESRFCQEDYIESFDNCPDTFIDTDCLLTIDDPIVAGDKGKFSATDEDFKGYWIDLRTKIGFGQLSEIILSPGTYCKVRLLYDPNLYSDASPSLLYEKKLSMIIESKGPNIAVFYSPTIGKIGA